MHLLDLELVKCSLKNNCLSFSIKYLFVLFLFGFLGIFFSCKEENPILVTPTLKFDIDTNYVYSDTILSPDQTIKIKLTANSEGSAITLFNFKIYNGNKVVSVDSGLNSNSFSTILSLTKGLYNEERWVFRVRNKDMQWDSVSLNIGLNPYWKFGPITSFSNIELGAQNNPSVGSFFSITNNSIHNFASATNAQSIMALCYYYDSAGDLNSLASPAANIPSTIFDFAAWTTRNEARFVQTSLSSNDFDNCQNDSLIIANTFVYQSGKRKCKLLAPGNIYSFIEGDIKGLIRFNEVVGTDAGTMKMDIKIQKQ